MSLDEKRGELIRQALERGGFNPRNSPMEGESYRFFIQSMKNSEKETMEVYKKRNSDLIVFSGTVFLAPRHYEKYRNLDVDIRKKFDDKLNEILNIKSLSHDITEDERGFGVWINDTVDHNELNNQSLSRCLSNVIDIQVNVYNFFMDFFYDKITL